MKKILSFLLCFTFVIFPIKCRAEIDGTEAKAWILAEQSTGDILAESNADLRLPIASVTKIMTMLLIMEEIDDGNMTFEDKVTVSENAMSYGGSTMFLETGEQLSVHDMLKGIAVASANDGCVAMAEYIAGSESAFVELMNKRAKELGMKNTHFMNTNGLDEDNHYSSARDVAIMSRELIKHDKIFEYTSIWTDELRDGKFKLANTNKLIRFYPGANGLKTGSTSRALCCLSASAKRDEMQLVAVVLGAETSAKRFSSAKAILDYGFANYKLTKLSEENEFICESNVENSNKEEISIVVAETKTLLQNKKQSKNIERQVFVDQLKAPIKKGDTVGKIDFVGDGNVLASVELKANEDAEKKSVGRLIFDIVKGFI